MKLKLVHYLVEHETVLPSPKNVCHPGLAHFRNDQFHTRDDNEAEKNVIRKQDFFSFDAVHPVQVPFKKPSTKNVKTLIQQFFSGVDNEDPLGSREPQEKFSYRTDLSLVHKVDYEEKNHNFTENQSLYL